MAKINFEVRAALVEKLSQTIKLHLQVDGTCSLIGLLVHSEGLFGPAVLLHDLRFFLGSEIVLDVEELADFLDALAFDEGGNLGAAELQQGLDIEVVGGHDDFEKHLLVNIDVVGVPLVDDLGEVGGAERLLDLGWGVVLHVLHERDHLLHDVLVHLGDRDFFVSARVFNQALDKDGLRGNIDVDIEDFAILAHESAVHLFFCFVV